jgi:hypothetical protein
MNSTYRPPVFGKECRAAILAVAAWLAAFGTLALAMRALEGL